MQFYIRMKGSTIVILFLQRRANYQKKLFATGTKMDSNGGGRECETFARVAAQSSW